MANINNNTTNLENILSDIDNIADPVSGTLSITVNGTHDVSTYASANVNVESAPVLLWENASPTSAFAPQTLGLNGAGYDAYLVECVAGNIEGSSKSISMVRKDMASSLSAMNGENSYSVRYVSGATSNGITFERGLSGSMWLNTAAVPTRIWGVKFTL